MSDHTDAPPAASEPPGTEVHRSLRAELDAEAARRFGIENLAGSMAVVRGEGAKVVAVATVTAESRELADSLEFVLVAGKMGIPTLRIRYPLERHTAFRYPASGPGSGRSWLTWISGSGLRYDGRRVTVSDRAGVLLYADVEVQVPAEPESLEAYFRNHVGPLRGESLEGRLTFDTGSGLVTLKDVRGKIVADTGNGDVVAEGIEGSLRCDTGTGHCSVDRFRGDKLVCDTGTGRVEVRDASARRVKADTGSGSVHLQGVDADEIRVDTAAGDLVVEAPGERLTRLKVDTEGGDVRLRLGQGAAFKLRAETGRGGFENHFADAEAILRKRGVVGYRRGDGRVRIEVETGNGNLDIGP